MKTTKEPQRAWLYARVPGNYVESKNTLNVLMLQAQRDGAEVVGWGYDIHHGWLRRPAYRRRASVRFACRSGGDGAGQEFAISTQN